MLGGVGGEMVKGEARMSLVAMTTVMMMMEMKSREECVRVF